MILSTKMEWISEYVIKDINTDHFGMGTELTIRQFKHGHLRRTNIAVCFDNADLGDYASISFWDDKEFVTIKWMFVYDIKKKQFSIHCEESVSDGVNASTINRYNVEDDKLVRMEDAVNA